MVSMSAYAATTSSLTHEIVMAAWKRHVIEPLQQDVPGTIVHTFLCFHPSGLHGTPTGERNAPSLADRRATVRSLYANFSDRVDVVLSSAEIMQPDSEAGGYAERQPVPKDSTLGMAMRPSFPDQYARLASCAQAMRQHELRSRPRRLFDWVLRARPDLLWVRRVPPFASLDPERVSLRARGLVFDEPRDVSFAALTTDRRGCDPRLFLTRSHANACVSMRARRPGAGHHKASAADADANNPKQIEDDPECEQRALENLRARMRRANVTTCGVWDDQCARNTRGPPYPWLRTRLVHDPTRSPWLPSSPDLSPPSSMRLTLKWAKWLTLTSPLLST